MISGMSKADIKVLVQELVQYRKSILPENILLQSVQGE